MLSRDAPLPEPTPTPPAKPETSSFTDDFSLIGGLIGLEVTKLDQGKVEHETERNRVEIDKLRAEVQDLRQDTQLRGSFSRQILYYLYAFSLFCAACILLQGFHVAGFSVENPVLITLVGGTAASAFGLVSVVLNGLFNLQKKAPQIAEPVSAKRTA